MDITVREKHVPTDRRAPPSESVSDLTDRSTASDASLNPMGGLNESVQNLSLNPNLGDDDGFDYCTEEDLQEFLLKRLELVYDFAVGKLVAAGYDKEMVLKALLRNGHCHGSKHVLSNILHNTLRYLNIQASGEGNLDNVKQVFGDLVQLRTFSLISLVCLLRRQNPCLSRGDAMWCLLKSDLHVGHASTMKIPGAPNPNDGDDDDDDDDDGDGDSDSGASSSTTDMECPLWSDPTPSMLALLKDNAAFLAAEYVRLTSSSEVDTGDKALRKETLEVLSLMNQEQTNIILKRLHEMNLEDYKDQVLVDEIKDLQEKVKERRKWAIDKEIQIAKRLCYEVKELKMLRLEREENQRIKERKPTLDVRSTMKCLADVENALKKASGRIDRADMVFKRLQVETMELEAEIVAFQLSSSESVKKCCEVAKREKKHLKKYSAWEKQRDKLQDDITSEKQKLLELQKEMVQVEEAKKNAEAKWREEQDAKKHALARVQQERRLKEETVSSNKRIQESLRAKLDLDFKLHKDDIQRLEEELSRVKSLTDPDQNLTDLTTSDYLFGSHFKDDTIGKLLHGSGDEFDDEEHDGILIDRECPMCLNYEVSVVFLPCSHQVVCGGCNEKMEQKGEAHCPTCGARIEERIRVFGSS